MTSQNPSRQVFDFSDVARMQTDLLATITDGVQDTIRNSMHAFCEWQAPFVKAQSEAVDKWSMAWSRSTPGVRARQRRVVLAESAEA